MALYSLLAHEAVLLHLLPSFFHMKLCLTLQNVKNTKTLTSDNRECLIGSLGVPSCNKELISAENPHQKLIVRSNVKRFWLQKT